MNQIIGWLVVLLMFVALVYFSYRVKIGDNYDFPELNWFPIVILSLAIFLYPVITWYVYKVALPNEYQATIEAIAETKELIQSEKQWNLEDIEIHKRLLELIKEKADFRAKYRKAMRNPFVLFKPEPLK